MGSYNSGRTSVSGTISATTSIAAPNANQTFITIQGTGDANVNTIRTVTAGKTFYVTAMNLTQHAANDTCELFANDGTTRVGSIVSVTSGLNFPISFASPIYAWTAGQAVKLKVTNLRTFTIVGYEQ